MKGDKAMFFENWLATNPGPTRDKEIKFAYFKPSDLRSEDSETLTGVGFMKTVKAFFTKELVSQVLESGYKFKDDNGKKTYVDFKWEGNDFMIDVRNIHLQKIRKSWGEEYFPNLYVDKDFALEMGWFVEKGEDTYDLGPNLVMEVLNDEMPVPVDNDPVNEEYWEFAHKTQKFIKLTMTCNWGFINLDVAFKNVAGTTKRSLFVYSDVGGSGVVGNQVTDLPSHPIYSSAQGSVGHYRSASVGDHR